MIEYVFINPKITIPAKLKSIVKFIPINEYKLQLQVYSEQKNISDPKLLSYGEWEEYRTHNQVYYFIAIDTNTSKLVGSISFFNNSSICTTYYNIEPKDSVHISQFYVDQNYRGMNIGTTLMNKVEEYAISHGYTKLDLKTSYSNTIAQSLYNKLGYEIKYCTMSLSLSGTNAIINSNIVDIDNRIPKVINYINIELESLIDDSIDSMILYNHNGFSFTQIKSHILFNIKKGVYIVLYHNSINIESLPIYSIGSILKNNSFRIFDILVNNITTNKLKYQYYSIIVNDIINYCKPMNYNSVSIVARIEDVNTFVKLGFESKMFYLFKKR